LQLVGKSFGLKREREVAFLRGHLVPLKTFGKNTHSCGSFTHALDKQVEAALITAQRDHIMKVNIGRMESWDPHICGA